MDYFMNEAIAAPEPGAAASCAALVAAAPAASGWRPPGADDVVQGLGLSNGRAGNPYILRGGSGHGASDPGHLAGASERQHARPTLGRRRSGTRDPAHKGVSLLRDIFYHDAPYIMVSG